MSAALRYGVKDALLGLFVGVFMGGLSGFGLYAMSAETLRCDRGAEGGVECVLSRRIMAVPVRHTLLSGVRGATLEEYYSAPRSSPFNTRQDPGGYTYHVRYDTAAGPVDSAEGPGREAPEALVTGLRGWISDGGADTYEASLGGGPLGWRLALGVLFVVAALCLVNIPFATVKALRARASGSAA